MVGGSFDVLPFYSQNDIGRLPNGGNEKFVVRSSASSEDSLNKTGAGKFSSKLGVDYKDVTKAIEEVRDQYGEGNVLIQEDITNRMLYSGVIYTNMDGVTHVYMGRDNAVHQIVAGGKAGVEFKMGREMAEMSFNDSNLASDVKGIGTILPRVALKGLEVERFMGTPTDIEFAILNNDGANTDVLRIGGIYPLKIVLLQARPLPNPTSDAMRQHALDELGQYKSLINSMGIGEMVLGTGNIREILGNDKVTALSVSIFNYVFSGAGEDIPGAIQLGRNLIGYDIGGEILPSAFMLGGRVYYNFVGDALQFRPKGIDVADLIRAIRDVYLPAVSKNPDLLNYPELRLYAQFPEQAQAIGLNPEPYARLAKKLLAMISEIVQPEKPPERKVLPKFVNPSECYYEILRSMDTMREGSAKNYVIAARLAFFAMESVRQKLSELRKADCLEFLRIAKLLGIYEPDPENVRDALVYYRPIETFNLVDQDRYGYVGSFELSLPRNLPKTVGKGIRKEEIKLHEELERLVEGARTALSNREKVKLSLYVDMDYLKHAIEQFGAITGTGMEIYHLRYDELKYTMSEYESALAFYRIGLRKQMKEYDLFGTGPFFESDLNGKSMLRKHGEPKFVFGRLKELEDGGTFPAEIGRNCVVIDSVDETNQTMSVPYRTRLIIVSDNIRPGSHIFTGISDYNIPVIAVPEEVVPKLKEYGKFVLRKDGNSIMVKSVGGLKDLA